jgi:probable HAF family extracellular repeat protein
MKQLPAIAQTFILTSFSVLSLFTAPVQAASFRGLGFLDSSNPNIYSYARGVSADGSVVVGSSSSGVNDYEYEAFRWTQETGMVGLSNLPSGNFSSATGVSADGSVVVGSNGDAAFRWTQSSGMVGLGGSNSSANDVSADGSVVVGFFGYSYIPGGGHSQKESFRWTQSGGMVSLGSLPGSFMSFSSASAVSADSSIVVGSDGGVAFRWTQENGMEYLSGMTVWNSGPATGVSADGSVIIGHGNSVGGRSKAFRWTQSDGIVSLGSLTSSSFANDVSSDGSIIVGNSGFQAFRWTQADGMVSLKDTLIGAGLDVSGWSLTDANAISADGFTVVGDGINPSGQREGWVANLSPEPVPEPLTILGSITAIGFAAGFERKFNKNKSDEKDPDA